MAEGVDEENFLFLEEEGDGATQHQHTPEEVLEIEEVVDDTTNVESEEDASLDPFDADKANLTMGVQNAGWGLTGMDCPDCAM